MLDISSDLQTAIVDGSQRVIPKVVARFADNRWLENLSWSSSNEFYENQILRNDCLLYWRFDDYLTDPAFHFTYDHSGNGINGAFAGSGFYDGPSPIQRTTSNYGVQTDSFNRTANTLGFMDGTAKLPWEIFGNGIFETDGSVAKCTSFVAGTFPAAVVDTGDTDGYIETVLGTFGDNNGLYARFIDLDNWIRWNCNTFPGSILQKRVAGVTTTIFSTVHPFANGDTVRLEVILDTVNVYHNGALIHTTTVEDDVLRDATMWGLMNPNSSTPSYDSVTINTYTPTDRCWTSPAATSNCVSNVSATDTVKTYAPKYCTEIFWVQNTFGVSQFNKCVMNTRFNVTAYVSANTIYGTWRGASNTNYTLNAGNASFGAGWTMIAMRKNDTEIAMFCNGVKISTGYMPEDISNSFGLGNIIIGAEDASYTNQFTGSVDEFSIHGTALTDKQIENLYYSGVNTGKFVGAGTFFTADQAVNGIKEESSAYAVSQGFDEYGNYMNLSGQYHSLANEDKANKAFGWWSRSLSDGSGLFTQKEIAWYEFDTRKATGVEISTGWVTSRIKDFKVYWITSDDVTHYSNNTMPLGSSLYELDFGGTYDVKAFGVEMISTYSPNDIGRIYEADLVYDVDLSEDVVNLNVDKVRDNYDSTLPIGLTGANQGSITLQNTDRVYNPYGSSDYAPYIAPDTEFFVSLGWELPDGSIEYIKLQDSLYVDSWNIESSGMTAVPALRDWSKYIQETTSTGMVFQDVTAGRAIADIMRAQGFPNRKIVYNDTYYRDIISSRPWAFWRLSDVGVNIYDEGGRYNGTMDGTVIQGGASLIRQEAEDQIFYNVDRSTNATNDPNKITAFSSKFDNSVNCGYRMLTNSELQFAGDWTIEATVQVDAVPTASDAIILSKQNASGYNYLLSLENSGAGVYKFYTAYTDNLGNGFTLRSAGYSSAQLIGKTFHLVASKVRNSLNLYINGVAVTPLTTNNNPTGNDATLPVFIGKVNTTGFGWIGSICSVSLYNRGMTSDEAISHWISSQLGSLYVFKYLYFKDATPWDAMLEFATADVGMFYFDEDSFFHYEYSNTFHESIFTRHQTSQYDFTDEENIKDGSHNVDVQTNRVIVLVNPLVTVANEYAPIWKADDGESLAVTKIGFNLNPSTTSISVTDTENPLWLNSGYFKVDDEIIYYGGKEANRLKNLQRGMFGTKPAFHANTSLCREARLYEIQYTDSPAVAIKRPFVTAKEFESKVEIDKFVTTPFGATVVLSATKNTAEDELVMLEGTNPITELHYAYSISGIPIQPKKSKEKVIKEVKELDTKIRKFRPKEITIDNQFIQDKAWAEKLATFIINFFGAPVAILNLEVTGTPQIQLGDLIRITKFDKMNIVNELFWVIESSVNYDGGIQQNLVLRQYTGGISG